jgi:hypothetical protein
MKNAMELPKCSKTLHFAAISRQSDDRTAHEQKANLRPEISYSAMVLLVFRGL